MTDSARGVTQRYLVSTPPLMSAPSDSEIIRLKRAAPTMSRLSALTEILEPDMRTSTILSDHHLISSWKKGGARCAPQFWPVVRDEGFISAVHVDTEYNSQRAYIIYIFIYYIYICRLSNGTTARATIGVATRAMIRYPQHVSADIFPF